MNNNNKAKILANACELLGGLLFFVIMWVAWVMVAAWDAPTQ
jgi:hypothetical protein